MSDDIEETLGEITERLDTIEAQLDDEGGDEAADEEKTADDDSESATEEKVDELAAVVEQQAELLEQMANAQGVSQQADTGKAASESDDKTWGENSPFHAGGDD